MFKLTAFQRFVVSSIHTCVHAYVCKQSLYICTGAEQKKQTTQLDLGIFALDFPVSEILIFKIFVFENLDERHGEQYLKRCCTMAHINIC